MLSINKIMTIITLYISHLLEDTFSLDVVTDNKILVIEVLITTAADDILIVFLTPPLVLFFICLYISSRALSKAFEHRNSVARYQRETNHITVRKLRPW